MRLWSLHPRYLDRRGLVAQWREGLLAQAVLLGRTKGYRHHPQLDRFRAAHAQAAACIGAYLRIVHAEAVSRGYAFAAPATRAPALPRRSGRCRALGATTESMTRVRQAAK
jgi:pyrimidine dimer DNA glycosylase